MIAHTNTQSILKATLSIFLVGILVCSTSVGAFLPQDDTSEQADTQPHMQPLQSEVLLTEGFEEGKMPPTNWSVDSTNFQNTWDVESFQTHTGDWAAWVPGSRDQNELLTTPVVDASEYTQVLCSFWIYTRVFQSGFTVDLLIDEDEEQRYWDLNINANDTEENTWTKIIVDLSDLVGDSFTVSWRYFSGGQNDGVYFLLDDIEIFGSDEFIVDLGGPYEAYVYEKIQFTPKVYGGNEPYQFRWNFGDNRFSTNETPTKYYRSTGVYPVSLRVTDSSLYVTQGDTNATILPWPYEINIKCGFGIKAEVTNRVGEDTEDIFVEFFIDGGMGGLLRIDPDYTNATIETLEENETREVQMFPVPIGFGRSVVTVTAIDADDNQGKCIKKVLFIGFFTIPLPIQ